jgi:hypothetical protein
MRLRLLRLIKKLARRTVRRFMGRKEMPESDLQLIRTALRDPAAFEQYKSGRAALPVTSSSCHLIG